MCRYKCLMLIFSDSTVSVFFLIFNRILWIIFCVRNSRAGSCVFNVPCIITTLITKERQRLVAALSGFYVLHGSFTCFLRKCSDYGLPKILHLGLWLRVKRSSVIRRRKWTASRSSALANCEIFLPRVDA